MKKAFIFPGQGSQKVGMVKDLYDSYAVVRELFEEADDALGFSLTKLCFEGPDEELMKTFNTQPAILTASTACSRVLKQEGFEGDIVAGHSLGEYSALVAAGSLSFADAVRTVRKRGQYMQEAVPLGEGSMDRSTQFAVAATKLALDDSKIDLDSEDRDRIGTVVGSGIGGIETLHNLYKGLFDKGPNRVNPFVVPKMIGNMASGQVSIVFGLRGHCASIVTACATGTNSIGDAYRMSSGAVVYMCSASSAPVQANPYAV